MIFIEEAADGRQGRTANGGGFLFPGGRDGKIEAKMLCSRGGAAVCAEKR